MPKYVHFIPVGKGNAELHLAGLIKFKADEVVLFSLPNEKKTPLIVGALRKIGAAYRTIYVGRGYFDAYRKANEEAAGSCGEDVSLGINMSTSSEIMTSAIEDAVRIQLHYFHRSDEYANCAAFRYYIHRDKKLHFQIAPIWNFLLYLHNDIFEVLAEDSEPMNMNQILESIRNLKPDEGLGFEAFRKQFRSFKRWFINNPCFSEQLQKSPLYKLDL